jgi:hypothetical protein
MYKNSENTAKGLAVYFYPELDREVIVVGVFDSEEDIYSGADPLYYTVWDEQGRLDKYDFERWDILPTRDEVKIHYIDLI